MLAFTRAAFVAARRAARRPPPTVGLRAGFQSLTSADAALEEDLRREFRESPQRTAALVAEFEAKIAASGGAEDVDALSGLGVTLAMRGGAADLRRAGELFARAVEADPSNADCLFNLGQLRHALGDADGAVAAWAAAVAAAPDHADAHFNLGNVAAEAGGYPASERAALHAHLGKARELGDDLDGADDAYGAALALDGSWRRRRPSTRPRRPRRVRTRGRPRSR